MLKVLFGLDVPWPAVALAAVAAVWFLGYRGIDVGAKVLGVLLVAETAILAVMGVGILSRGGVHGISTGSFAPEHAFSPGVLAILGICFAAFMGFESTVLYRGEARNPDTSVPRATYIAVGFMSVFYAFIVWTVVQAYGEDHAVEAAGQLANGMFFETINHYVGPWAEVVMYLLIVTSVYASQLAFHNAINRYVYMLARDGVLPAFLGRTHHKYKSPTGQASCRRPWLPPSSLSARPLAPTRTNSCSSGSTPRVFSASWACRAWYPWLPLCTCAAPPVPLLTGSSFP